MQFSFFFFLFLLLRRSTDLIPWVQLRIPPIDTTETLLFSGLAIAIFLLIWLSKWVYELRKPLHNYYVSFLETWFWWLMLLFSFAYLGFWYVFVNWISRFVLIWSWTWFLILGTLFDWFWNYLIFSYEKKHPYTLQVLSSDRKLTSDMIEAFSLYDIYHILEVNERLNASLDTDFLLALWDYSKQELQNYADHARIKWQVFSFVSDHLELEDLISSPTRIWPIMALSYVPSPLEWWRRVGKRFFDVTASGMSLLLLSPLLFLIALWIKLDSSWPVFYRHKRVGKWWEEFLFTKFRTMFTHLSVWDEYWWDDAWTYKKELMESDANVRKWPLQKIENDPRVTRFGWFLRKTSLDELPNLFNVFRWHMSLVWPRPHEPFEVEKYESWHKRLLSIKPWMTWYAQLFWRDKLAFDEEAKLDLYYIQNWSLFLDIYVLVSTVKVIFKGR